MHEKMFKIVPILIVIVIVCGCISGGGGDTTTPTPTTAPTTSAPTTAAPTTAAPTTAAPTTVAPTTAAPTEPPKPSEMEDAWTMQYHDSYNSSYSSSDLSGTPEVLWYKNGIFSSGAVIEYGMVYIPVVKMDDVREYRLTCLDLQDGSLVWEQPIQNNTATYCHNQGNARTAAVSDGKVVFLSCETACIMYCFDAYDGTPLWQTTIDAVYRVYESPVIYDGKIYTLYTNPICQLYEYTTEVLNHGMVCCCDLETGNILWTKNISLALYGTPVLYDGRIYFGAVDAGTNDGYLICLDADNGDNIWMSDLLDEGHKLYYYDDPIWQIAYGHGNIYVTMFDYDWDWDFFGYATIGCYDAVTGERNWKFRTESGTLFDSHLVVSEDYVYFGILWDWYADPDSTYIYKMNPVNGNIVWRATILEYMEFMSMGGSTLYLGYFEQVWDDDAQVWVKTTHIYGLNGNSGVENWTFSEIPDYLEIMKYKGLTAAMADGYMVVPIAYRLYCFS